MFASEYNEKVGWIQTNHICSALTHPGRLQQYNVEVNVKNSLLISHTVTAQITLHRMKTYCVCPRPPGDSCLFSFPLLVSSHSHALMIWGSGNQFLWLLLTQVTEKAHFTTLPVYVVWALQLAWTSGAVTEWFASPNSDSEENTSAKALPHREMNSPFSAGRAFS